MTLHSCAAVCETMSGEKRTGLLLHCARNIAMPPRHSTLLSPTGAEEGCKLSLRRGGRQPATLPRRRWNCASQSCKPSPIHCRLCNMPSSRLLIVLVAALAACSSPSTCTAAAAAPAATDGCSATCMDLQAQPLRQWSAERSEATVYTLPWDASYAFHPLDYVALAKEVCACLGPPDQGE